ncbi:MAG TPA: serine hydrolase [Polyangiaceae bacterium]|nr:serine hydrolase [Polyangiaceae bacterium]
MSLMTRDRSVSRFFLALVVVSVTACNVRPGIEPITTSGDGWDTETLQTAGLDEAALSQLTQDIEAGNFPNTHAVLIEHDGHLVYEQYFAGTDERWGEPIGQVDFDRDTLHDLRSISKTVTSLVLGIVLASEYESALERPLPSFFPKRATAPELQAIKLHHALTMTAGIEWNEMTVPYTEATNDEIRLYSVADPVAQVLNRPVRDTPGSVWYYNGGLTQVLAGIVYEITGKPLDKVATDVLFTPLGITEFEWLGSTLWYPPMPAAMSGLRMRARDLAKIGSVCLHGGKWKGRQIVPKEWIERSTQRHVKEAGAWSQGGVWGYGYQFWVGGFSEGYDVVAARGNGDQNVFILKKEGLVVTTFAGAYNRFDGYSEGILHRIMAARK